MRIAIIGAGSSAKGWGEQTFDLSIGVNDCYKFGYAPDQLVLINFERKFTSERLKVILKTPAKKVWTHTSTWKKHFPDAQVIKLSPFNGYVRDGLIYSSRTSPIVALSLAVKQGASEIVIFGVDMLNHHTYKKGTKQGDHEINTYLRFFDQLEKRKIKVYRGADGTAFDLRLPLLQKEVPA